MRYNGPLRKAAGAIVTGVRHRTFTVSGVWEQGVTAFAAELDRALALRESGDTAGAAAIYRTILAANPDDIYAHYMLGEVAMEARRYADAERHFAKVSQDRPDIAAAHSHLGTARLNLGRAEESLTNFEQAAIRAPDEPEFHNNWGTALLTLNQAAAALPHFDRALAINPTYLEAHYNRGIVLLHMHRGAEALAAFDRVVAAAPRFADAHYNRSLALISLGRTEAGLEALGHSLQIKPDNVVALQMRGEFLQTLGRHDEAAETFAAAAAAAHRQGNEEKATDIFCRGFGARLYICDWQNHEADTARFTKIATSGTHPAIPLTFLSVPRTPAQELICARTYARHRYLSAAQPLWHGERYDHDRIRVAYVSSDFRRHPVGYLMAGIIEAHDRKRFEVIGVSLWPDDSDMRRRFEKSFDRMIDVALLSEVEAARQIRALEVDILVHLNGFTTPDRVGLMTYRPAPLQVNYLGYTGTLGVDYVDYILADRYVVPPGEEAFYCEKVVWLPDCYQANDGTVAIAPAIPTRRAAGLPDHGIVFCAFNRNPKITPQVFAIWMRLLQRVPGSVLWLTAGIEAGRRNLCSAAARHGIAPERLIFAPTTATLSEHLARHTLADVFLDTTPYPAHTTASDSLRCGVPVVTVRGNTFTGRVAGSLLHAVGLPELIAESLADYEDLAYRLATSATALSELKAKLRHNLTTSALFDTHRMTRSLEKAYTIMWERHRSGDSPASFTVPAEH